MVNFKNFLKNLYNFDNASFIEETDEGTFVFYPTIYSKGYEVETLRELTPILLYWRISTVFSIFFIMTLSIILLIFLHQIFDISGLFTIVILTICLTSCIVSGFFMITLRKYHRIKPKQKLPVKTKAICAVFGIVYLSFCVWVLCMCPCLIYGHNIENQEWQKAMNKINFYIKFQPKNDNLYENRALAKYNLNDIDGAIKDCDKALELNPKNSWVLSAKAYYTFIKTRKMTPEINSMFEKSMNINKKHYPIAYSDRAKVYYLLGESNKAVKDFEQAYLKSGNEYFNYFAAIAYEQKGDYCKAFAYYNTVPQNKHFNITELPMKKEYARFMCKD